MFLQDEGASEVAGSDTEETFTPAVEADTENVEDTAPAEEPTDASEETPAI